MGSSPKDIFREKLPARDNTGEHELDYDIAYDALVVSWNLDSDGDMHVDTVY